MERELRKNGHFAFNAWNDLAPELEKFQQERLVPSSASTGLSLSRNWPCLWNSEIISRRGRAKHFMENCISTGFLLSYRSLEMVFGTSSILFSSLNYYSLPVLACSPTHLLRRANKFNIISPEFSWLQNWGEMSLGVQCLWGEMYGNQINYSSFLCSFWSVVGWFVSLILNGGKAEFGCIKWSIGERSQNFTNGRCRISSLFKAQDILHLKLVLLEAQLRLIRHIFRLSWILLPKIAVENETEP